jgi:uncharacterized surface protein with fasciclin (FAS1) repeats
LKTPPLTFFGSITSAPLPYCIELLGLVTLTDQYSALLQNLSDEKNVTYFATNSPSAPQVVQQITNISSPNQVSEILQYNIIQTQMLYSHSFTNGSSFITQAGINVTITTFNESTYVNDAKIIWGDILVANGVLHVIDKVRPTLIPHE